MSDDPSLIVLRAHAAGDAPFTSVAPSGASLGDDRLADLIEADARLRLERGLPVDLDRYLGVVPALRDLPVSLDAAIEFSLRAMAPEAKRPTEEQVARLADAFPDLREPIEEAAALAEAICSTEGLRTGFVQRPTLTLPVSVGPVLSTSGERRFSLERLIGRGAQGAVYAAIDRRLSSPTHPAWVAVKVLDGGHDQDDDASVMEEATRARRIDHPNVVRVIDADRLTDGRVFIVYELVDRGDLEGLLKRRGGSLPAREAAGVLAAVARGVQAAHGARIVHCDLKPGNILLGAGGTPKVADFGVAVALDAGAPGADDAQPFGSVAFISPEQFRMDDGALSASTDVFALGGILFYLLTGDLPNGDTRDAIAERLGAGADDPARFASLARRFDRDLAAICCRALHHDPRERHGSAYAFARDLEAWSRAEPIYWTDPPPLWTARLALRRRPLTFGVGALAMVGVITLTALLARQGSASGSLQARVNALEAANGVLETRLQTTRNQLLAAHLSPIFADAARGRFDACLERIAALHALAEADHEPVLADVHRAMEQLASVAEGRPDAPGVPELRGALGASRDALDPDLGLSLWSGVRGFYDDAIEWLDGPGAPGVP